MKPVHLGLSLLALALSVPAFPAVARAESLVGVAPMGSERSFDLFWFDAQVNASYANISRLASTAGPAFSLGVGIRLTLLVIGLRLGYSAFSSFSLWQGNLEVGAKIPVSHSIDFLLKVHGGGGVAGSLDDAANKALGPSSPSANEPGKNGALNAGLETGLDYYITRREANSLKGQPPIFSVGFGAIADVLALHRERTSTGLQVGGGVRFGVHLGF